MQCERGDLNLGKGTDNVSFFPFEAEHLSTTFEVGEVGSFRELLREGLDWRLAQYLNRRGAPGLKVDIVSRPIDGAMQSRQL